MALKTVPILFPPLSWCKYVQLTGLLLQHNLLPADIVASIYCRQSSEGKFNFEMTTTMTMMMTSWFLLKLKASCNFWVKYIYMGTCLNMWNERASHWATPVFMLRFVRFLSSPRAERERAAHHFCACTHILSWQEWNKLTHALLYIHSLAHIHARAHAHTVILTLAHSHNPQSTTTLYETGG